MLSFDVEFEIGAYPLRTSLNWSALALVKIRTPGIQQED